MSCLKDAAFSFQLFHGDHVNDLAAYTTIFKDTFSPPEGLDAVRLELERLRLAAPHTPTAVDAHILRFKELLLRLQTSQGRVVHFDDALFRLKASVPAAVAALVTLHTPSTIEQAFRLLRHAAAVVPSALATTDEPRWGGNNAAPHSDNEAEDIGEGYVEAEDMMMDPDAPPLGSPSL
jgi:hypothetical protein